MEKAEAEADQRHVQAALWGQVAADEQQRIQQMMGEQSGERNQEDAELDAEATEVEWGASHLGLLRQVEQRRDNRESARESEA